MRGDQGDEGASGDGGGVRGAEGQAGTVTSSVAVDDDVSEEEEGAWRSGSGDVGGDGRLVASSCAGPPR